MDQKRFLELVGELRKGQDKLLKLKGDEYSGPSDRLGNFKRGAELTGATPQQVCFIYLSKHYDALATYVRERGSVPQSEPIRGRVLDLMNYCCLLYALMQEEVEQMDEAARTIEPNYYICNFHGQYYGTYCPKCPKMVLADKGAA